MQQKIETRITELKAEYQKGEERLALLEQEMAMVKSSMLRISGALQVLEELMDDKTNHQENVPISDDKEQNRIPVIVQT